MIRIERQTNNNNAWIPVTPRHVAFNYVMYALGLGDTMTVTITNGKDTTVTTYRKVKG